ncbi:MAG: SGNH/GDSL hydrolase family protein [Armatimonadota bacterium]
MLRLPTAPDQRRVLLLGDHRWLAESQAAHGARAPRAALDPPGGWRVACLAVPRSTAAAVRYVQVPRFLEMDFAPDWVAIAVGSADLEPVLIDPARCDGAIANLAAHTEAALDRIRERAPGAVLRLSGIDPAEREPWPLPGPWVTAANDALAAVADRVGAGWIAPDENPVERISWEIGGKQ